MRVGGGVGHALAVIASKFLPACQILLECRVLQVFHLDPSEIKAKTVPLSYEKNVEKWE